MPWHPVCVALTQIAPLPDSGGLPSTVVPGVAGTVVGIGCARHSAERSRLNPPAL